VGETLLAPTRNPLINSLADDRIRGRANSISGFATSLMLIVSPAIVTSLLAAHLGAVWIALLCLASLGVVAIAARLRVILTAEQEFVNQPPVAESALVEQLGDLLEQEGESLYPPMESPCVNGQVEVPAGGQLKVPTPCGCSALVLGSSSVVPGVAHPI
jgi:MFS family permease